MNEKQETSSPKHQKSVSFVPANVQMPTSNRNAFAHRSEQEIWEAFCKGNNQAFSFLYNQYVQLLFRYGCQLTPDRELVQDAIQSLFLDLRTRESKLPQIVSIKSYLLKALYRTLLRLLKRESKFRLIWRENREIDLDISFSADSTLIGSEFTEAQQKALTFALNNLPKRQKEAMVYYFYEGMDYEEIAFIMGLKKVHSARKLIYKGVDGIKQELGESYDTQALLSLLPFVLTGAAQITEKYL